MNRRTLTAMVLVGLACWLMLWVAVSALVLELSEQESTQVPD